MALTPSKLVKIFCSFASEDQPLVNGLWDQLEVRLGCKCHRWDLWRMDQNLVCGDGFDADIKTALAASDVGAVALSPALFDSTYVLLKELPTFLGTAPRPRIFPITFRALPKTFDMLGIEKLQVFKFNSPYMSQRGAEGRNAWTNDLADALHKVVVKYDLGS